MPKKQDQIKQRSVSDDPELTAPGICQNVGMSFRQKPSDISPDQQMSFGEAEDNQGCHVVVSR